MCCMVCQEDMGNVSQLGMRRIIKRLPQNLQCIHLRQIQCGSVSLATVHTANRTQLSGKGIDTIAYVASEQRCKSGGQPQEAFPLLLTPSVNSSLHPQRKLPRKLRLAAYASSFGWHTCNWQHESTPAQSPTEKWHMPF